MATKKKWEFKKGFVHSITIFFLILTFASWGVADYVRGNSGVDLIAKVGKVDIPLSLFEKQLERFRAFARQERPDISEEEINHPRMIQEQLAQSIREQMLTQYIEKYRLYPSVDRVAKTIANQQEFSENGVFSPDKYLQTLKQMRQNPSHFEDGVRHSLSREMFFPRLALTQFITPETAFVFRRLSSETRKVFPHRLQATAFEAIQPTNDDIKKYFESHQTDFDLPARVKTEYIDFSALTLTHQITDPTDAELETYWDELKASGEWKVEEKRSARHLLIRFGKSKEEAKKKIDDLLARAKKKPNDFPTLATQFSEDPGSASQGGLIKDIVRGQMVEAFDRSVFSLPQNTMSEVIETPFGYHIIRVEKITSPLAISLSEVKKELLSSYREREAKKLYDALAEDFLTLVEEQKNEKDGLKKIADKYQLPIGSSPWISQTPEGNDKEVIPFDVPAIRAAALSTSAIESGAIIAVKVSRDKRIVALRVTQHEPRTKRSFDEAKEDAKKIVREIQIREKMMAQANDMLAQLRDGRLKVDDVLWERPIIVNRVQSREDPALLESIFSQPSSPLPTFFLSAAEKKQVTLYRLDEVKQDSSIEKNIGGQIAEKYNKYWADKQDRMVLSAILSEFPVSINRTILEKVLNPPEK